MRRKVIAGNWKMNMLPNEAIEFITNLAPMVKDTKNEVIISKKPISYFRERLNASYFAIPHHSFIVNLNFVRSYQRERIELECGETVKTVYIASRKQPDFKKKFMSFIGEQ